MKADSRSRGMMDGSTERNGCTYIYESKTEPASNRIQDLAGDTHDIDVLQVAYILHLTLDELKDDAKESSIRDTDTRILLIRLTSDASAPISQYLL